ncbi:nitroreductase family protein [Flavobacterium panacagri]|uniref:nitroreductase family protein n=1 Tax=Flavobacterium panacagri TaxID=3034146 RepID=UPI003365715E
MILITRALNSTGTLPTLLECGFLLQNIILVAHAHNLGTCPPGRIVPFLNHNSNANLISLFHIPSEYEIAITLALGYPDENPEAPIR